MSLRISKKKVKSYISANFFRNEIIHENKTLLFLVTNEGCYYRLLFLAERIIY